MPDEYVGRHRMPDRPGDHRTDEIPRHHHPRRRPREIWQSLMHGDTYEPMHTTPLDRITNEHPDTKPIPKKGQ